MAATGKTSQAKGADIAPIKVTAMCERTLSVLSKRDIAREMKPEEIRVVRGQENGSNSLRLTFSAPHRRAQDCLVTIGSIQICSPMARV